MILRVILYSREPKRENTFRLSLLLELQIMNITVKKYMLT